jgi:hypothetical protein
MLGNYPVASQLATCLVVLSCTELVMSPVEFLFVGFTSLMPGVLVTVSGYRSKGPGSIPGSTRFC